MRMSAKHLYLFLLSFFIGININAQNKLDQFRNYETIDLQSKEIKHNALTKNDFQLMNLDLGGYGSYDLEMRKIDLRSDHYKVNILTESGTKEIENSGSVALLGHIENDYSSEVALTVNDGFIYGMIRTRENELYIEPMRFYKNVSKKESYLVYEIKDVISDGRKFCNMDAPAPTQKQKIQVNRKKLGDCYNIEYAFANDFLMFQKYGNARDLEDFVLGNLMLVQTDYDDAFDDELKFVVTEQFISSCDSCDPWTNNTDAGILLRDFSGWGPSNFENEYDVASLWTDRNFNNGTLGVAWLSGVCDNDLRHNTLSDFTANASLLRVVQSHELAHNFSCPHDSPTSQTIMRPSVNDANVWSELSLNSFHSFYPRADCLDTDCTESNAEEDDGSGRPLTAFRYFVDGNKECFPLTVSFFDDTENDVDSRFWSFEGGTPAFAYNANPRVTYNSPGVFDVLYRATNENGAREKIIEDAVSAQDVPTADFTYEVRGGEVKFTNSSTFGATFIWRFGDGRLRSGEDVVNFYRNSGSYDVRLVVRNECGENEIVKTIVINDASPIASFESDRTEVCEGNLISFTNSSTGQARDFMWSFPGGTPSVSEEENPSVIYESQGSFEVQLITLSNTYGNDTITIEDAIVINPLPVADFSYVLDGTSISLTNLSSDFNTINWEMGDGTTFSGEENPNHTYDADGEYAVTLRLLNDCGVVTKTDTINTLVLGNYDLPKDISVIDIFPNPTADVLNLQLELDVRMNVEIQVLGMDGKVFTTKNIDTQELKNSLQLNTSQLNSGAYFIAIITNQGRAVRKFVKL